jgi:hypothetical protein
MVGAGACRRDAAAHLSHSTSARDVVRIRCAAPLPHPTPPTSHPLAKQPENCQCGSEAMREPQPVSSALPPPQVCPHATPFKCFCGAARSVARASRPPSACLCTKYEKNKGTSLCCVESAARFFSLLSLRSHGRCCPRR